MIDFFALLLVLQLAALRAPPRIFRKKTASFYALLSAAVAIVCAVMAWSIPMFRSPSLCEVVPNSPAWNAGLRAGMPVRSVHEENNHDLRFHLESREVKLTSKSESPAWWIPELASELLDRWAGATTRCYPPILEARPFPKLFIQGRFLERRVRVESLGGARAVNRYSLAQKLTEIGEKDVWGLQYYAEGIKQNSWLAGSWLKQMKEPAERAEALGLGGFGWPIAEYISPPPLRAPSQIAFGKIISVNEQPAYSVLPFLADPGSSLMLRYTQNGEKNQLSLPASFRLSLLPAFVEGIGRAGPLAPVAFSIRAWLAVPASFSSLADQWSYLPRSWYEVASYAPLSAEYWLFRLSCAFTLAAWLWAFLIVSQKKYAWHPGPRALNTAAFLLAALHLRDLYYIIYL